jgi:hypothetical protein
MKALTIHPLSTHSKRVLFALLTCATGCASAASDSDPTTTVSQGVSDHNRDRWEAKHCNDDDIESVTRTDYLLPFTSNLPSPNNQGQAYLTFGSSNRSTKTIRTRRRMARHVRQRASWLVFTAEASTS